VQTFLDGKPRHGINDLDVALNLKCFEEVGKLRLAQAQQRNMVPHRTGETRVRLDDGSGVNFVAIERMRNRVERYSEQLSLMCNIEGAAMLRRAASERIQPIYRTHAPPDESRLEHLEQTIAAVAKAYNLGDGWVWDRSTQSLGEFIRRLPGDADKEYLREALQHQAILVNVRSMFTAEPGPHFGIGADVYARFSAPMREIVGIYVHKELWELLDGVAPTTDESLRDSVIDAANTSRQLQRDLTHQANRLVLDQIFEPELQRPIEKRPIRRGVVLGFRGAKVYIRLLDPPIEVKVYAEQIDDDMEADAAGSCLLHGGECVCRLGEMVTVRLRGRDDKLSRWLLELV
jgi:exoribonuclease R